MVTDPTWCTRWTHCSGRSRADCTNLTDYRTWETLLKGTSKGTQHSNSVTFVCFNQSNHGPNDWRWTILIFIFCFTSKSFTCFCTSSPPFPSDYLPSLLGGPASGGGAKRGDLPTSASIHPPPCRWTGDTGWLRGRTQAEQKLLTYTRGCCWSSVGLR